MTGALGNEITRGTNFDVIFVGGGLACGLAALALRNRHPRLRMLMCEAETHLGGNHTWSFHDRDVDDDGSALLAPLVVQRLENVDVAFPDHERRLPTGYSITTSASLDRAVRPVFDREGSRLCLGQRALRLESNAVVLANGERLTGGLVFDGRGPTGAPTWVENQGFQKFLGLEVEVKNVADFLDPTTARVMDARVPQLDGFRFVYALPLSKTRLLVEDTYYSDRPTLERDVLRARVLAYLDRLGARNVEVVREEAGVLGIPWTDDSLPPLGSPVRLGARGGWFHPTTGYTLPVATRVALTLAAKLVPNDSQPGSVIDVPEALSSLARLYRQINSQSRFARRLNRLMFRAVAPEDRWGMLSRFYRLPQPCIERFFALESTPLDRTRILFGRPPRGVSLRAAFAALQTV
ncbi:MAG TPA: lycopene beta-cyclase CrtY [Polyangia bacterium]